jgi:UDP-N-acetylglucosamine 2-epimerase
MSPTTALAMAHEIAAIDELLAPVRAALRMDDTTPLPEQIERMMADYEAALATAYGELEDARVLRLESEVEAEASRRTDAAVGALLSSLGMGSL